MLDLPAARVRAAGLLLSVSPAIGKFSREQPPYLSNFRSLSEILFCTTVLFRGGRLKLLTSASDQKGARMTPNPRIIARLAFAAVCLTVLALAPPARAQTGPNQAELITNGPQTNPGDRAGGRSAAQNVRDSQNYESTVHTNSNFRAAREQKECGSIDDARMHADCLATFDK